MEYDLNIYTCVYTHIYIFIKYIQTCISSKYISVYICIIFNVVINKYNSYFPFWNVNEGFINYISNKLNIF